MTPRTPQVGRGPRIMVSVRVPEPLAVRMKLWCVTNRVTMQDHMERLVAEFLDQHTTPKFGGYC